MPSVPASFMAFATYIGQQLILDPRDLAAKFARKTGIAVSITCKQTEAEIAEELGEYSEAIAIAKRSWYRPGQVVRNTLVRIRCKQKLRWFQSPIFRVKPSSQRAYLAPRVIYICGNSRPYTNSGYSKRTHSLVKAIADSGVEIFALTRLNYPAEIGVPCYPIEDSIDGVVYRRNTIAPYPLTVDKYVKQAAEGIARQISSSRAVILHTTTSFHNAVVVSDVAKKSGIPWIYELRGEIEKTWLTTPTISGIPRSEESEHFRLSRNRELAAVRAASGVIVLSEIARRELISQGIDKQKILVVPNAAEAALFETHLSIKEAKMLTDVDPTKVTIGSVTSIVPYEGLDTLIRSLEFLPQRFQVMIVGGGSDESRLKQLVNDLGVSERVRFAGKQPQEEIIPWYRALDVFVVPRNDVSVCRTVTPVKPLAAMALGIPVVASDLPALREVTGNCASYCNPGDPSDLANAIKQAYEQTDLEDATEWARSRTWDRVACNVSRFYNSVLSNS